MNKSKILMAASAAVLAVAGVVSTNAASNKHVRTGFFRPTASTCDVIGSVDCSTVSANPCTSGGIQVLSTNCGHTLLRPL